MVNWNEIRDEFPVCKKMVYLNPAGGSPVSRSAAGEAIRFYREMLEFGDTYWDEWLVRTEGIREKLAAFLHADRDEIAFTTNTSVGMNHVAHMVKGSGDVLTMRDEFPSSTFPWLNQGIRVHFVEPENGAYSTETIEKSLTPEIKILVTSWVQYKTGFRQDLEKVGKLCKERNLIFVVNATQAMGIFPVDVKKCHIDFLVFTGLKWLTTGYGIGGLYAAHKWLDRPLPYAGWRSARNPGLMDNNLFELKHAASVLEAGSPHFPNVFALGGALDLIQRIGSDDIMSRVLSLNRLLRDKLEELGFTVISPAGEDQLSGITVISVDEPGQLVKKLREKGIFVAARGQGVRISVSFFNNEEDIFKLTEALKELR